MLLIANWVLIYHVWFEGSRVELITMKSIISKTKAATSRLILAAKLRYAKSYKWMQMLQSACDKINIKRNASSNLWLWQVYFKAYESKWNQNLKLSWAI